MKDKLIVLVLVLVLAIRWGFNPHRRVGAGRHFETTRDRWDRLTRPLRRPGIRARARRRARRAQARAEAAAWAWWQQRRTEYHIGAGWWEVAA